ncbi:MAG TPA: hypothetical protein VLA12_16735 [Planctomycetaceae bacterium]|nr:hypothetical protein [Planctomycetaceae bacterium]
MRIGLDLDGCVMSHPEFFRELVESFTERGHQFFCTSGRGRDVWESKCVPDLLGVGIDPNKIDPRLMTPTVTPHVADKGRMADHLDLVFDDDAARIQRHTNTPVLFVPVKRTGWAFSYVRVE